MRHFFKHHGNSKRKRGDFFEILPSVDHLNFICTLRFKAAAIIVMTAQYLKGKIHTYNVDLPPSVNVSERDPKLEVFKHMTGPMALIRLNRTPSKTVAPALHGHFKVIQCFPDRCGESCVNLCQVVCH